MNFLKLGSDTNEREAVKLYLNYFLVFMLCVALSAISYETQPWIAWGFISIVSILVFKIAYGFFGNVVQTIGGLVIASVLLIHVLAVIFIFAYGWASLIGPCANPCMMLDAHM
ncbi:MAG TPA: hypothetical protein VHQ41_01025 [Patescibacteria group bacterium]|jgi:hypothetical protein|nr:hypothetical protein [Patescibacteria group bacterium]